MAEYRYAKGRIAESVEFISQEIKEFKEEYAVRTWKDYCDDKKLQKLMDRTVENILTALIEISGTILVEEGKGVDSYSDTLRKCGKFFDFPEQDQDALAKLGIQRNRLAHRYLNFRWQAIKMFADNMNLVVKITTLILEREERKIS